MVNLFIYMMNIISQYPFYCKNGYYGLQNEVKVTVQLQHFVAGRLYVGYKLYF